MGFISIAHAQSLAPFDSFLSRVSYYILNPLIGLFFALALMYFIWGVVVFIKNTDNETEKETGKNHMIWGIIGLFIMIGVYGIIGLITGTFAPGVQVPRG
ncbi:MAG: hypothetical protein AAB355_02700 [Patescibacteria group bacterium]